MKLLFNIDTHLGHGKGILFPDRIVGSVLMRRNKLLQSLYGHFIVKLRGFNDSAEILPDH